MGVTVDVDPPGRNPVEQTAAVLCIKPSTFTANNLDRRTVEGFLRVRMPDVHVKTDLSKCRLKTQMRLSRLMASSHGIAPTTGILPYRSIAFRFSEFSVPTMTTPISCNLLLRAASTVRSV